LSSCPTLPASSCMMLKVSEIADVINTVHIAFQIGLQVYLTEAYNAILQSNYKFAFTLVGSPVTVR
jgi:hypothetical protein